MDPQAFKTLEFDSLRALVARNAQTQSGRQRLEEIAPIDDFKQLQLDLVRLHEMIELRHRGARLPFAEVVDPSDAIARLRIAGTALEPLALLDLAHLCDRASEARAAILKERELCPTLLEILAALPIDLKKLSETLRRKILPSGELDDRASPQLASIRRDLTSARSRITRSLENLMRRSSEAIQEELVTVRNDRFVIPVRADHQSRIKGVAHGSSSSGATVFIEPLETIEANNELQTLREAEQREIAEILFALSEELRGHLPAIELAAEAITGLDFINAKAAFAERFAGVVPVVTEPRAVASGSNTDRDIPRDPVAIAPGSDTAPIVTEPRTVASGSNTDRDIPRDPVAIAPGSDTTLELIDARHPLLQESLRAIGDSVVPISLRLDHDHPVMIISGANAGGKTVVLKTAGLLSLMALSGLPAPAKAARVPFYRSVLADIGDHQSLAANLSTFTSHVANIASMIESCQTPALVLLDEVGTGTDPEEGSALGVAVVDHFKQSGAHVLATTHYSGLKMYAASEPGILNASVEFDERTLRPTYRLLVGLAGSSSGLEMARRFGISDEILTEAAKHVQRSSLDASQYLRRIKQESEDAEVLRQALEEERAAVAERFASLEKDFRRRESTRQVEFDKELARAVSEFAKLSAELLSKIEDKAARVKVEREAERRAAELKREAQRAAKVFSASARSSAANQKSKSNETLPAQLRGVRVIREGQIVGDGRKAERVTGGDEAATTVRDVDLAAERPAREVRSGDRVRLRTLGSIGIVDRIKDDEAEVRVGSLHMREKLANLELIDERGAGSRDRGNASVSQGSLEQLRQRAATTELYLSKQSNQFKNAAELNLIGKKTDEAGDLIDKFLDEAFLNGAREIRIIHGHGTGALRKAVAEVLSDHPHVARFSPAPQEHGGTGATIVELKQ